ncbi:MAG: oligosaccharide flippase family protein [Fuerstiella sp.]|nr:oligosaccharide flippase family protein [Fuerstiella sp.]
MINGGSVMFVFVVGHAASMLSILLIAGTMSTDDFGKLSSGLAVQNYIVLLGSLGLRTLATRDLARSPDRISSIWGTLWGLIGPIGAAVALAGYFAAASIFSWTPDEMWMFVWLSAGGWFSMLSLAPLLDAVGRQSGSVASVALPEVLFLVALVAGLLTGHLIWLGAGFALKWVLASTLQAVVLWRATRPECLQVSRDVLQSWRKSAPWLLATALISHLPFAVSVVLVRSLQDASEAAVTGLAVQIATVLLLVAGLAFRYVQPMLRTADDLGSNRVRIAIQRICGGLVGVWLLGTVAAWILTSYWLPATFHQTWPTFFFLLTAALFGGSAYMLWAMLNALEMALSILAGYSAGAVLFLCAGLLLIPSHGHLGGAWAVCLATLATVLVMLREVRRGLRQQQLQPVPD